MKRNSIQIAGVLAFVLSLGVASSAAAQEGESSSQRQGLWLRLSAGPGVAQTAIDDEGQEIKFDGVGADFNLAVGGKIRDSLAVHATLAGWYLSRPTLELTYGPATFADEYAGGLRMTMLGAGVTAYFGDGFYVSPAVGFAILDASSKRGRDQESDVGGSLDLTTGKEWRVSPSWSIGAAAALGMHYIPDSSFDTDYTGGSVGLRFSATFD